MATQSPPRDPWSDRLAAKRPRPTLFATAQPAYNRPTQASAPSRKAKEKEISPPQTLKEATGMGIKEAGLALKQSAQGAMSMVAGPWGSKFEGDRKKTEAKRESLNTARNKYYGGDGAAGFAKEALARLPGNAMKAGPELLNPFRKATVAAKAGNAGYHAARSYASHKSPTKALTAAASNVVGEKAESLLGNLPGNAAGTLIEKASGKLIESGTNVVADKGADFIASIQPPKRKK